MRVQLHHVDRVMMRAIVQPNRAVVVVIGARVHSSPVLAVAQYRKGSATCRTRGLQRGGHANAVARRAAGTLPAAYALKYIK